MNYILFSPAHDSQLNIHPSSSRCSRLSLSFSLSVPSSISSSPGSVLFVHARLYLNQAVCCLSSLRLCVTPPFANKLRLPSKARDSQHTEEVWTCSRKPCVFSLDHVIRVEMEIRHGFWSWAAADVGKMKKERDTHTHTDAERCAGAAFFF